MSIPILVLVTIEILLMIGIPIAAVIVTRRKWGLPLSIVLAGAITFVASQVLHVPANGQLAKVFGLEAQPLVVQAIVLGLSAGVFEEVARYIVMRFWQKNVRSWREAFTLGLGHGGVEAILIGLTMALTLANMVVIVNAEDIAALGLPEGAAEQVAAFWEIPLYTPLLAVLERVIAMTLHVALSTVVALCFSKRAIWPLFAAILWHAFVDALAVYGVQTWGNIAVEGILLVLGLLSIGILVFTKRQLEYQV